MCKVFVATLSRNVYFKDEMGILLVMKCTSLFEIIRVTADYATVFHGRNYTVDKCNDCRRGKCDEVTVPFQLLTRRKFVAHAVTSVRAATAKIDRQEKAVPNRYVPRSVLTLPVIASKQVHRAVPNSTIPIVWVVILAGLKCFDQTPCVLHLRPAFLSNCITTV
jgi:hypothetical protein